MQVTPEGNPNAFTLVIPACQALVRFFALLRIKQHPPPLVRAPVNSFEFQPCDRTPQAEHLMDYLQQPPVGSGGYLVLIVYGVDYQGI